MSSNLLNPALGRAAGAFTLAAGTVNSSGVFTPGTAKAFTGQLLGFDMDEANETENISAITSRNANEAIIETLNSARMNGFLFANDVYSTSATNPIWYICQTSDYVQLVGSWAGRTLTFVAVIKRYSERLVGKGKIEFECELGFPDIGAANPAWS